jgi:propionyl-CoA synthetase
MRGTMRKIADGDDYPMPATIDDPAVLGQIEAALQKSGYGAASGHRPS